MNCVLLMKELLQMGHEIGTCSCLACFALFVGGGGAGGAEGGAAEAGDGDAETAAGCESG